MVFRMIYNVLIEITFPILWITGLFSKKINLFSRGRSKTFKMLEFKAVHKGDWAWFHAASLGEFEQVRPLILAYKKSFPEHKILLTFFSPSGYEIQKNFSEANCVCYLPWDSVANVNRFLNLCNLKLAIFVKYEFWPNYFDGLFKRNIPIYSVSSIFRPEQLFFQWYGRGYQKILHQVEHFFVQNENSKKLLNNTGIKAVTTNGDTRIDRVYQMVQQDNKLEIMNSFTSGAKCFVAGSTWPEDYTLIENLFEKESPLKFVIAPHEVSQKSIVKLEKRISLPYAKWSSYDPKKDADKRILILDNIGQLGKVYSYAAFAYVGGGMKKRGLHNTLEPATYGIPVIIGKYFDTFQEALDLVELGGLFTVQSELGFKKIYEELTYDAQIRNNAGEINAKYISKSVGASQVIIDKIKETLNS